MFDFNGTLSDDEPLLLAIYQELFARHGRPLSGELSTSDELAGNTEEVIIGTWLGVDGALLAVLVQERIATYVDRASSGSTVTRAVREAVRYAAARVPVAIVSGAFRAEIEPVVAAAGIADQLTCDRHRRRRRGREAPPRGVSPCAPEPRSRPRAGRGIRGHRGRRGLGQGRRASLHRRARHTARRPPRAGRRARRSQSTSR